ncbi:hypothetical protein V5D55_06785 [Microbacterium sp. PMB16]
MSLIEYRLDGGEWAALDSGGKVTIGDLGSHELEARGTDSRGNVGESVTADAEVSWVTAAVLVNGKPASVLKPGQEFTVAVQGAEPGSDAIVELHSDPVRLGAIAIAASGSGELAARVPTSFAGGGAHEIVVTAVDARGVERIVRVPVTIRAVDAGPAGMASRTQASTGRLRCWRAWRLWCS